MNTKENKTASTSNILASYKTNSYIINIAFFAIITCAVFADALTPPVILTFPIMFKKIIFIIIFSLICKIIMISIKCVRILLKRRLLVYECAANKYLEVINGIFQLERRKEYKLMCIFDMVPALMHLGRYDEALNLLNSDLVNINKLKKYNLLRYYLYSSQCCFSTGNIDKAKKAEDMAGDLMKHKRFNFAQKKNYKEAISGLDAKYAYYRNDFIKARQLYGKALITSGSPLASIVTLYHLALIDMKENKSDCAREKFEIVVQYGNELNLVNKSKEYLNTINLK